MTSLPPEIDTLMWSVAESGDPQAVTEFQNRFPEHRLELMKRVNAITGLRKAKVTVARAPSFRLRMAPRFSVSRPLAFALIGALLTALALGSYLTVLHKSDDAPPSLALNKGSQSPESCVQPVLRGMSRSQTSPIVTPPVSAPPVTPSPSQVEIPSLPNREQRPTSIHIDRAELHLVLDSLSAQAGWDLTIAPGVPDPEVHLDYDDVPIVDIVKDLGRRFGFSAVDEGGHKVFILPVSVNEGPENDKLDRPDNLDKPEQPAKNGDKQEHSPKAD
jgi:hypothetical protein